MLSIQESSKAKPPPTRPKSATTSKSTVKVNILPCRIQHTGPAKVTKRYWSPITSTSTTSTVESDGGSTSTSSRTAYFRGRKLKGRALDLPPAYTGTIARSTTRQIPKKFQPVRAARHKDTYHDGDYDYDYDYNQGNDDEADDDLQIEEDQDQDPDMGEPVTILERLADFQHVTVWAHDQQPSADDPFARGLDEWISLAQAIHLDPNHSGLKGRKDDQTGGSEKQTAETIGES